MAAQKQAMKEYEIKAVLTEEERDLLEAFAAEQGVDDMASAIPLMLHELVRLYDELWDKRLEQIPPALEAMGQKAVEDERAGLTENLDI